MNTAQTALSVLAEHLRAHEPIPTIRVSSAQARGNAKNYPYWGAVRYEIRLTRDGRHPTNVALERASSDRRSYRLAERDADTLAADENRILVQTIGKLDETTAERVLAAIRKI